MVVPPAWLGVACAAVIELEREYFEGGSGDVVGGFG